MSRCGGARVNSFLLLRTWKKRMIKPMRVEMPERWENSKVHPDMSIGESIIQAVIQDPQDRATKRMREDFEAKWMSPTDGLSGSGKINL
jgi:hypothetical protein